LAVALGSCAGHGWGRSDDCKRQTARAADIG
jgi:hypothetical protein